MKSSDLVIILDINVLSVGGKRLAKNGLLPSSL
jgi:hypothetical protein